MLSFLTPMELGRLRMSVGYGGHKKGRPLSPVEVGQMLERARSEGMSLKECAHAVQLDGTGHIGRFLRILRLPTDVRHIVDWGSGGHFVGFSAAVELVRLQNDNEQRRAAQAVMAHRLSSKEVRDVVQLRLRSKRGIDKCVLEVVGMRPSVETRYVLLGSVAPEQEDALSALSQVERDDILSEYLDSSEVAGVVGRLGPRLFTLVGTEDLSNVMKKVGQETLEAEIRKHIARIVGNVP